MPNTGSGGTSGGSGGTAGSGADAGTGAVGSGGDTQRDPTYTCLIPPAMLPAPMIEGMSPALAASMAVGGETTDLLTSAVALNDGGSALLVTTGMSDEACTLYRISADDVPTALLNFPHEPGRAALVAEQAGKLVVAGVATRAFTADDVDVATTDGADGFIYLLDVDEHGNVSSSQTFPFTGALSLTALVGNAEGDLVLAGALDGRLDIGDQSIEPPTFEAGPLRATFVARLGARRTLSWQRVFHATGKHNDPPALDGAGGTDGFGQSTATDLAWTPDDGVVVSSVFSGGIDLDDLRFPNDDYTDGLVVELDRRGTTRWGEHIHGLIGAYVAGSPPSSSGGTGANIPSDGTLRDLRVDVDANGRVAATAAFRGYVDSDGVELDGGTSGHLSVVLDGDGAVINALPDGGDDVSFDANGDVVLWNGSSLFALALDGSSPWTLAPVGQLLAGKPSRLRRGPNGLWLAGSFLGAIDFGGGLIASNGCADAFAARLAP